MRIELQMVGAYQNVNKTFKGVPFVNGRASVVCADEHVAGICRYLQQFGAYQLVEAEVLQAKLDKDAGKKISKKVAMDRVARHRAALMKAEAELAELDGIDGEHTAPEIAAASEPAPAPISRRPPPRVVTEETPPAAAAASPAPEPATPPQQPTETEVALAADIESEFADGGSSDQENPRRERREATQGGGAAS